MIAPVLVLLPLVPCAAAPADLETWSVSPLARVWPDSSPPASGSAPLELSGARGEVASGQLAVRCAAARKVGLRAGDLAGPDGARIPAAAMRLRWERRIALTRNTVKTPPEELDRAAPCEVADPFWEDAERSLDPGRTEGIWIEILIPRGIPAGTWRGSVTLEGGGGRREVPLSLRVWDFDVPEERHLDVVQWFTFPGIPFSKTVETYSGEWWALAERFARIIAEHRQNVFRAPFSYIRMTYTRDAGFVGDFSRFDRWVETFLRAGRFDRIELDFAGRLEGRGLGDPKGRIRIRRLPVVLEDPAAKLSDEEVLRGYLGALCAHLRERGWFERSLIHIQDEPFIQHEKSYRDVARILAEAAPGLDRIDAIEGEDFFGALEVWVPKLSHLANWYETAYRRAKAGGAELWFYTCCHPTGRYPNRFLDYPLLKTRLLHWIAYLYDLDGYLHWGLNHFWGDDPFCEDGVSRDLPPGDRAVCYPARDGYAGSLRWSAMRDGLEDFEYLWVLEDRLRALKERYGEDARRLDPRQRPTELCRRVVQGFREYTRDPEALLAARRSIAEEIEALARGPLLAVQTSPPDGSPVPGWPRVANLWGIAEPGAEVTVNGRPVANRSDRGVFWQALFLGDAQSEVVVEARIGERVGRAVRRLPPGE
ncbi:MAG: DUF4091 domain-containing protein [Planctomycetes bacterium]|nr:DUF4091 domain-containing protein [Planctomycetota bacterium]